MEIYDYILHTTSAVLKDRDSGRRTKKEKR